MAHAKEPVKMTRKVVVCLAVLFVLAELAAFWAAWNGSGRKAWLQVRDPSGAVLYETRGDTLTRFDRYYFEQNFGPIENYQVQLVTRDVPFPLTPWLFAAIGVPVGLMLFFVFVIKIWRLLFPSDGDEGQEKEKDGSPVERGFSLLQNPGVLAAGGLVFIFFLALWIVPVLLARTASSLLELIWSFRWVFGVLFAGFLSLCFWFLYLRYRLARQAMETQAGLERLRLTLEGERERLPEGEAPRRLLTARPQESEDH